MAGRDWLGGSLCHLWHWERQNRTSGSLRGFWVQQAFTSIHDHTFQDPVRSNLEDKKETDMKDETRGPTVCKESELDCD